MPQRKDRSYVLFMAAMGSAKDWKERSKGTRVLNDYNYEDQNGRGKDKNWLFSICGKTTGVHNRTKPQ